MPDTQVSSIPSGMPAEYTALCPLDGRYSQIAQKLAPYFSEYALMKNRVKVEILWLQFLLDELHGCDILDEV